MKLKMTIALCNLELNLMIALAKQQYIPENENKASYDLEALNIGLELGAGQIGLSATMHSALDNINLLDKNVYDAFFYAYNGSLRANGGMTD